MNLQIAQYRDELHDFCASFEFTHIATLKFIESHQTPYAASRASKEFIGRFEREIWGRHWVQKRKAALAYMPILQDGFGKKELHLHCAIGNIKPTWNELQVLLKFGDVANETRGLKRDEWHFKPVKNCDKWIRYMTRELNPYNLDYCLFEQFARGIKPSGDSPTIVGLSNCSALV